MVTGLGAMDLKNPKYVKLNSELGTSATAKASVAATASKTRSSGKPLNVISQSSGVSSGSVFFTKAVRFNMQPRPVSGRNASLYANARRAAGQRFNALSQQYWASPSLSTYNQSQVAYKQSTASSFGEALGALAGLITTGANAYKTLNEAGIFNKKSANTASQPKTNSGKIDKALDGLGSYTPANMKSTSSEVSGYIDGMQSCTDAASLKTAITLANGELTALDSATSIYDTAVAQAESDKQKLNEQVTESKQEVADAKQNVSDAEQSVKGAEEGVKRATEELKQVDQEYGQAVENYNTAHDQHVDAKNATERAESKVEDTTEKYNNAKANTASAKASCKAAEQAWQSCPDTIEGPNGTRVPNPEKAKLKAEFEVEKQKLKQAEQEESNAKIAKETAEKELKQAKSAEEKASKAEEKALNDKEAAYKKVGDKKAEIDKKEAVVQQKEKLLDKQKSMLEKGQEALDSAQSNYNIAKEKLEGCDSYRTMLKEHTDNVSLLQDSISSEEQRLSQLEKNENSQKSDKSNQSSQNNKTYDAGNLVKNVTVTGGGGKKIRDMNFQELMAKREELASQPNPDTDGIALIDQYIDKYKNTIAG